MALTVAEVRAEMPLQAYVNMQNSAPEQLIVAVVHITAKQSQARLAVEIEAVVIDVMASASNVTKGETIQIIYDIVQTSVPGPSNPPLLNVGSQVPAYLRRQGPTFYVAAGGKSFENLSVFKPRSQPTKN